MDTSPQLFRMLGGSTSQPAGGMNSISNQIRQFDTYTSGGVAGIPA